MAKRQTRTRERESERRRVAKPTEHARAGYRERVYDKNKKKSSKQSS